MKLTNVRVKDFRSFLGEHDFELADGVNYFVGPNNCGKSNLLRAVALVLDPITEYDVTRDRPTRAAATGAPPTTRITLTFHVSGSTSPELTLLRRAREYELAVRGARGTGIGNNVKTYADEREIRVVATFAGGRRHTSFQAKGQGAASLPSESVEHQKVVSQFGRVVRFAVIRTGEDLESLLAGKFREILQLVIADHLGDEMARAEKARQQYVESLQAELLEPLRHKVEDMVGGMFREISVASLVPDVPTLDSTLSSVDVRLGDSFATTPLSEKGTGVRGAVLTAMLQYLAEQSTRSLVLAVEEPESFLHPAAQEAIKTQLEALASPSNVSLLITTHSPYVISRRPDALVRELGKDAEGWTSTAATATGDEDRGQLLGSLYRDGGMASVLERALRIPDNARAVLVTEGYTDGEFLAMACAAAGESDLLDGLHVIPAGGAKKTIVQAILAKSATELPVVVLVDFDDAGKGAAKELVEFGWNKSRELLSLQVWPRRCNNGHDVEVEDLIPFGVADQIVKGLGEGAAIDSKIRCGSDWHVAYSTAWKRAALLELPRLLTAGDAAELVWLATEINARIQKIEESRAKALQVSPAQQVK